MSGDEMPFAWIAGTFPEPAVATESGEEPFARLDTSTMPAPVEEEPPTTWTLGFGPFEGQKVGDVPTKYLRWLLTSGTVGYKERKAIADELMSRPGEDVKVERR